MKLEEIHSSWAEDNKLTVIGLESAISDVPKMHAKYLRMMSEEKMTLRRMEEERKQLYKLKHDYYSGVLPEEDLRSNGWEPNRLKILKSDMGLHLDADQDIAKSNLRIAMQQEKVDVLEQIIRHIGNRGFLIKSMIDWQKFQVGA
jgi:hypothetical protein